MLKLNFEEDSSNCKILDPSDNIVGTITCNAGVYTLVFDTFVKKNLQEFKYKVDNHAPLKFDSLDKAHAKALDAYLFIVEWVKNT